MNKEFANKSWPAILLVSIVIISAAMHARHFNKELMGLHVWRQTETQSTINNFYEEDMNILNPRRNERGAGEGFHRMEFPLMQWMVAATYKVFGQHLIITRLWMFVIGIFSILGIYKLIKTLSGNETMALFGAWAFNFSPSFYYYTINPMPDNLALCFSIWGLAVFFVWVKKQNWKWLLTSGFLLSLSTLCKLPFVLYFSVPFFYFFLNLLPSTLKSSNPQTLKSLNPQTLKPLNPQTLKPLNPQTLKSVNYLLFLVPPLVWYVNVIPGWHGNGIVQGILDNKASSEVLMGHFFHHLFITLPELLLNYGSVPILLAGFYFLFKNKEFKSADFKYFAILGLLLVLYFLFELNMIGKSHDYYFFPFLPLLFILVSYGAYSLYISKVRYARVFILLLMLVLPIAAFLRIDSRWNTEKPGFNKDLLIFKDELRQVVPKDALCIAGNDISHFIFFYYIDKKGWNFDYDGLDEKKMEKMISEGADYLYSDSRKVEENPWISKYFDKTVFEKGSIKVIKLKANSQGFQP